MCNCSPRTDNPGHTINTILHVAQCNAIESGHTIKRWIYNAMGYWIGGIQLTRPAEIALFPRLEEAALGVAALRTKCLIPQNINDQI